MVDGIYSLGANELINFDPQFYTASSIDFCAFEECVLVYCIRGHSSVHSAETHCTFCGKESTRKKKY